MTLRVLEFLLSGFTDNSGEPLSGGKVYSYEAGTLVSKSTYTDHLGATPETNPIVLDSNGRKQVYGSGSYKFIIKTSSDVTLYTLDNVYFDIGYGTTFLGTTSGSSNTYIASPSPAISTYVDGDLYAFQSHQVNSGTATLNISGLGAKTLTTIPYQISSGKTYFARYSSSSDSFTLLNQDPASPLSQSEISTLNTAGAPITIRSPITLTSALTITSPLKIEKGGSFITNGFLLTISGSFEAGLYQVFTTNSSELTFSAGSVREIYPEWFGALGDASNNDATAIQLALDIGGNYSVVKLTAEKNYKVNSTLTIPITRDYQTILGYGARISGNVNGNIIKISDTSTTNDHSSNIAIIGVEILGSGSTDTTNSLQNGIEIDAIIGLTLRDVIIREIPQTGIVGTKSAASGSTYWNKVTFDNVWVRFCGSQTLNIGTASAVDDLTMINCLLNHGGCQVTTNAANGSAYIKAISLNMVGCEISGNYSSTTVGAGYRWGLQVQSANGVIQGCHFEINGNNQAGSADLLFDTEVNGMSVIGCGFYGSSTSSPKYAFQDTGKNNRFDTIGWASAVSHAYDYIAEVVSSTNCHLGIIACLNNPQVGPNVSLINPASTTVIERTVEKGVTASRPTPYATEMGRLYLDTTLDADGMPIFWQGTKWIKADGTNA